MKKRMTLLLAFLVVLTTGWSSQSAIEPEMIEIECTIKPIARSKIHPKGTPIQTATGQIVSSNWSGYVAASNLQQSVPGSVSHAAGAWTVPTLLPTPDTSYCAIWVGIDGFNDSSVEQMGTSHDWVQGAQQNYAWFEMYPNGSFEINGFPVDNGDQISARIAYIGNDIFKMVMFNHTKGVTTTIPYSYTTSSAAQRSSAEWIVEAPYSGEILPLSDFKLATLNYCSAIIDGMSGTIGNWMNDAITMEGSNGVKAQTSALLHNGSAFTVTWQHE
jgi:hypothetical protein